MPTTSPTTSIPTSPIRVRARPGGDHDHHQLDLDGHGRQPPRPGRLVGAAIEVEPCSGARRVQVTTEVQNLGLGASPSSSVFFVLTGQTGSLTDAIFLGETTIPALAPGAAQQISQTITLPVRLPSGVSLGSVGYARIEVLTNPENDFDESIYSNGDFAVAAVHRAAPRQRDHRADRTGGRDAPLDSGSWRSSPRTRPRSPPPKSSRPGSRRETPRSPPKKLHRKVGKGGLNIAKAAVSVGEEITKLPNQVYDAIKRSV